MKFKTKIKRLRKQWVGWLLLGDDINGAIDDKFEGIINYALEEYGEELIQEILKAIDNAPDIDYVGEFLKDKLKDYSHNVQKLPKEDKDE